LIVIPSVVISQVAETPPPENEPDSASAPAAQSAAEGSAPKTSSALEGSEFNKDFVAEDEATLRLFNRQIVVLRAIVAENDPDERAEQAADRITALPTGLLRENVWYEPAIIRGMGYMLVGIKDQVLIALRPEDLPPTSDQTIDELAIEVAANIQEVLRAEADQRHWPNLIRGIGLSLAATALFVVLMWGVLRLRSRMTGGLTRRLTRLDIHLSGFDLKPYLHNLVQTVVNFVSWGLILPLGYLWLTFVLKRFPYTRPWGVNLGDYLVELLTELALGALSAIPGLFTVLLIFLFNRFLTRVVTAFFISVESEALHVHWLQPETARATRRLVIVVMWVFALTVAYPYIPGSHSSAFKGVSVFVGLMVSLGATGLVNQIVSGMVIVYTRAFRPGEFVRIADTEGTVEEIGVLSTKLKTLRHEHVTIPNAVLINASVNNYSRDAAAGGSIIATSVTIGYDTPWRQVHALLELAAQRCSGLREGQKPRVLQKGLSDFYVEYTLLVSIDKPAERYIVASELNGQIQDAFNEHGVQIMSPHFLDKAEEAVMVAKSGWAPPPADPEEG